MPAYASAFPIENNNILVDDYKGSRTGYPKTDQTRFFFRGGAPLGNKGGSSTPSGGVLSTGDPRTNNETLNTEFDVADAAVRHTRFFMTNYRSPS